MEKKPVKQNSSNNLSFKKLAEQSKIISLVCSVPDRLKGLGDLYEERNALYKDNYMHFGKVLKGVFREPLILETEEEHNRHAIFLQIIHKATRYANSIKTGGHKDSLADMSVYAQMLAQYDDHCEQEKDNDEVADLKDEILMLKNQLKELKGVSVTKKKGKVNGRVSG